MKKDIWLGIDIGQKGALVALDSKNSVECMLDYSEIIFAEIRALQETYNIVHVCLEQVNAMPGQGVSSMFSFGTNYGKYQGALLALGVPFSLVRPQEWMRGLGLPAEKTDRKKAIAAKAQAMFPTVNFYGKKGGLLDGRSDAALIANYCREKFK